MANSTMMFLENFQKGDYMCWHVCSQCSNRGTVILRDNDKVYFTADKKDYNMSIQHLSEGFAQYTGGRDLRIEITVHENCNLHVSMSGDAILDTKGRNVGFIYDYCVEDGSDDDFNDFFINIVAWRKKG